MRIAALAGGIGASKLLLGLYHTIPPRSLTIIVNTGDDIVLHGLAISPDLDIVTYTLAGVANPKTGWGCRNETFAALKRLAAYGREAWFNLGDRDLATHIHRTALLQNGATLSDTADSIRRALGVEAKILPMSDQPVGTMIETNRDLIHFQEYLVKLRARPAVRGIRFHGIEQAEPAPGVLEALATADCILICPSNPLISIGPILAVPGIRHALRRRRQAVVAVCPLVGGKSLKGPSDRMLRQLGFRSSALGVAKLYRDIVATYVIDPADARQQPEIEALGMRVAVCPTVMRTLADKKRVARAILALATSNKGQKEKGKRQK